MSSEGPYYGDAFVKFNSAVFELATGPGDVRSRLWKAFLEFSPVTEKDLPEYLRDDYRWIKKMLVRYKDRVHYRGSGDVQTTLYWMRNTTGSRIAEKIVNICERLREYSNEQNNQHKSSPLHSATRKSGSSPGRRLAEAVGCGDREGEEFRKLMQGVVARRSYLRPRPLPS